MPGAKSSRACSRNGDVKTSGEGMSSRSCSTIAGGTPCQPSAPIGSLEGNPLISPGPGAARGWVAIPGAAGASVDGVSGNAPGKSGRGAC